MMEINDLGWVDYLIIAVMLCISAGIGIYYRFGRHQKTVEEYFVANRSINIMTVALMVSVIYAITLLGLSTENYTYGIQIVVINISYLLGTLIVYYGFLPVFYNLQTISAYEYLEKRFEARAKMMVNFVYWIRKLLYSGLVFYALSLALETTTGTFKIASIIIIDLVCAFYSNIDGIKAVLITNVFQAFFMFAIIFLIIGTIANNVGKLEQIWQTEAQGQHLEFDKYCIYFSTIDLDPTIRQTWSVMLGGLCTYLTSFGVNQVQIQRMLTVKNMQASQRAMWLSWPILSLLSITTCFSGLVIYSRCDPLLKKKITSPNMLIPLNVIDTMSNILGLPGLFLAGIFSAALSMISAALNSLAAVTLEDYMKSLYRKCIKHEFSSTKSASFAKMLAFTFNIISIVLAFLAQFLPRLLEATYTIFGVTDDPLLDIFTLGIESATESDAIAGALTAFSFLLWIALGQPCPIPPKLPTIESCDNNIVNITMSVLQNVTNFSK